MATGRPCFPGQIGRCGGPCSMKVTIEEHRAIVDDFVAFMAGGDQRIHRASSRERMREASAAHGLRGRGASYRDQLQAIDAVLEKSAVVLGAKTSTPTSSASPRTSSPPRCSSSSSAAVASAVCARGRSTRSSTSPPASSSTQVLQHAYGDAAAAAPARCSCPSCPTTPRRSRAGCGDARASARCAIRVAQRGDKAALLQTATQNAQQALMLYKTRRTRDYIARIAGADDMQEALGIAEAPLRIECFDVSHLSGTNIVASMVVFEDGLPRKDQYRRFTIPRRPTTPTRSTRCSPAGWRTSIRPDARAPTRPARGRRRRPTADDAVPRRPSGAEVRLPPATCSSSTAASRRSRPRRARSRTPASRSIYLCGIAKRLEEVWTARRGLPGHPAAQQRGALPAAAPARRGAPLRDHAPAHSAASATSSSVLAEIPGLGPARVKALLRHFGSVAALKERDRGRDRRGARASARRSRPPSTRTSR